MARRNYRLPDREQKRGCATVPVPREDVLVDGRVPKGCRFHPDKGNGTVLCTPKIAQKVGVLEVERKKPVPKPGKGLVKRKYCYVPESPFPYRKDGELKQGCEEDEESGKICCDRSYFKKSSTKKAAKTARKKAPAKKKTSRKKASTKKKAPAKKATRKKSASRSSKKKTSRKRRGGRNQQSLPGVDGLAFDGLAFEGLDLSAFDVSGFDVPSAPLALADAVLDAEAIAAAEVFAAPGGALALLDDGGGLPRVHEADALLPRGGGLQLAADELPALPEVAQTEHLSSFGDMALTWLAGTALAAGGVAAIYEGVDRMDYFDDKPGQRAAVFVGAGVGGALAAWGFSQNSEYGHHIRTVGAAWGITLSALGILGLIRTALEQAADDSEDPDEAKRMRDAASHVPWPAPHEHDEEPDEDDEPDDEPDDEEPDPDEDEVSTDGGGDAPGTSGLPYPHSRFFR